MTIDSRSGLAASWSGAIRKRLYVRDGVDWATVELTRWHGEGTPRLIYDGPANGSTIEQTARIA